MYKLLPFFGLFFIFSSCQQETQWVFDQKVYSQKSTMGCEADACTTAQVQVPILTGKEAVVPIINDHVRTIVGDIVAFDQEEHSFATYDDILNSFIQSYDEIKKAFPNEPMPWEARVTITEEVFRDKIVNFVLDYYTFTGGAHGNPGVISVFYNLENGKEVPQKDLFVNYEGFKKLVKTAFYKQYHLKENASLNDHGFMFEGNVFYLPENIIIRSTEVVVRYNHYEIASYADGPTELRFTYEQVKPFLNELYFN